LFENRVLREIFGPKRNEVKGDWRKLHKEELRNLYLSLDIVRILKFREMRLVGRVERIKYAHKVFIWKA
jgi:hypothetical protein